MEKYEEYYNTVELLFDKIVFPKHPELESWEIDESSKSLLLWVDMNMVDFDISEVVDHETFLLTEEEYDYDTSDYIFDIITSEIRETVYNTLKLIPDSRYRVEFILST